MKGRWKAGVVAIAAAVGAVALPQAARADYYAEYCSSWVSVGTMTHQACVAKDLSYMYFTHNVRNDGNTTQSVTQYVNRFKNSVGITCNGPSTNSYTVNQTRTFTCTLPRGATATYKTEGVLVGVALSSPTISG